jgi:hypothetical protein
MIILVLSRVPNAECSTNDTCEINALDVGGVDPPTIEWMFPEDATMATGVTWDGAYTGQTELTWAYSSWVNDTDGVDTVFFQYRHATSGDWMNRTPSLVSGDSTNGEYSYTFVQEVSWDWDTNQPVVEGGLYVEFRIYANDSLGNWRTTLATSKGGNWLSIQTPTSTVTTTNSTTDSPIIPLEVWLLSGSVVVIVIVIMVAYRRR